jgi:GT2 family glycosyltransferase
MKWSIIIPTYEKEKFTISCLKDLSKLSLSNHEIIIVDNSFTENTRLAVEELNMPNVKYNRSDINTFSHACNVGYKKCFGENILFLNNDIKVQNYIEWTELLLNTINENEYVITDDIFPEFVNRPGTKPILVSNNAISYVNVYSAIRLLLDG